MAGPLKRGAAFLLENSSDGSAVARRNCLTSWTCCVFVYRGIVR